MQDTKTPQNTNTQDFRPSESYDARQFQQNVNMLIAINDEYFDYFRARSMSYAGSIQYPPEFVPKPKPKFIKDVPSPMRLNSKGIKEYKRNKSKILVDTENFFLSCPEDEDTESNEDTNSSTSKPHNSEQICQDKNFKDTRRVMEQIKSESIKNISKEYEEIQALNLKKIHDCVKWEDSVLEGKMKNKKSFIERSYEENFFSGRANSEEVGCPYARHHQSVTSSRVMVNPQRMRSMSILNKLELKADIQKGLI